MCISLVACLRIPISYLMFIHFHKCHSPAKEKVVGVVPYPWWTTPSNPPCCKQNVIQNVKKLIHGIYSP